MRASIRARLLALTLIASVAGCGDSNETNIVVIEVPPSGVLPTATFAFTVTPSVTTTPVRNPTPVATETAMATPVGATSTAQATATTAPVPTATPAGSISPDVQLIAADILPFLTNTVLLTGGSIDALTVTHAPLVLSESIRTHVEALKSDPCPDGGARDDDEGFPARTLTFNACDVTDQLGSFRFEGDVVITLNGFEGGSIAFDFTLTDRTTSHPVDFLGTLPLTVSSGGFVLNGALTVTTPEGRFTLQSNKVTINGNRKLVSGSGTIPDDDDNFDLETVTFVIVRGGASANVTASFDDGATHTYTLDLESGVLVQNS